jgi:hypothetical protein
MAYCTCINARNFAKISDVFYSDINIRCAHSERTTRLSQNRQMLVNRREWPATSPAQVCGGSVQA